MLLVEQWKFNKMNEFYGFRTYTLVPIATSCVEWDLLDSQEAEWVKEYNRRVYETIAPLLDKETAQWLSEKYL